MHNLRKWGTSMQINNTNKTPKMYTIREILSTNEYIIPMYQRNFEWEDKEILQLIDDILDFQTKAEGIDSYYIGSLVVYYQKEKNRYEVIDGQQRLTTLTLLATYLKSKLSMDCAWYQTLNLTFECRESSTSTLIELFKVKSPIDFFSQLPQDNSFNSNIVDGYRIIHKNLDIKLKEKGVSTDDFAMNLFKYIKILKVEVPGHTDLNHYFEVMNNRGEQREKHEVLKARMLDAIKEDGTACSVLHNVWEATANMQKYIQTGFVPELRTAVFSTNWDGFEPIDFYELHGIFKNYEHRKKDEAKKNNSNQLLQDIDNKMGIDDIINSPTKYISGSNKEAEGDDRFNSVVNFPNFLLHVLRIHTRENVRLDDKVLLEEFDVWLFGKADTESVKHRKDDSSTIENIKSFIYCLLKVKYLFDSYIIKREYQQETDGWELKSYKQSGSDNKLTSYYANSFSKEQYIQNNTLMLLASFHVSIPTMNYKHWLNGALYWLYGQNNYNKKIEGKEYLDYLKCMANSFLFDRYLTDEELSYYKIIYSNHCIPKHKVRELNKECGEYKYLMYGYIKNNFVFNYLDYLIWQDKFNKSDESNQAINQFEFSFRSSVEHFYSQNPDGYPPLDKDDGLDSFGNLCLITHSQNSSFSNKPPLEKLANIINKYLGSKLPLSSRDQVPNLKMIELAKLLNKTQWDIDKQSVYVYKECLDKHEKEMLNLFVENQCN